MQKRNLFYVFIFFLILSIIIFLLFLLLPLKPVSSFAQNIFAPVVSITHKTFSRVFSLGTSSEVKDLKEQNLELSKKLVDQSKISADNKALRDQFAIQFPKSSTLIPADIIGSPSFIPGVSSPESYILNKGEKDGVKKGQAVLYKDNLVGIITEFSDNFSKAELITSSKFSLTAKTLSTGALGIAKGQGGQELILDNVLLSENLKKDDLVVTRGDVNEAGEGIIPDLVLGKIVSVQKSPSALFQTAKIKSFLDFASLSKVFIVIGNLE